LRIIVVFKKGKEPRVKRGGKKKSRQPGDKKERSSFSREFNYFSKKRTCRAEKIEERGEKLSLDWWGGEGRWVLP